MKQCSKCGRTFTDEDLYCSTCGTKLILKGECPKCGAKISENDIFCSKCGTKLKQSINTHHIKAESVNSEKESTNESSKHFGILSFKQLSNIIIISLFALVAILMSIGFFGSIIKVDAFGISESQSIGYFFGEEAKNLKDLFYEYKFDYFYNFSMATYIAYSVFYFLGLIAMFISAGFGIYHSVKCITSRTDFNKKYFLFMIISSLPYVMTTSYMLGISTSKEVGIKISLGWGTSMLFAAIIISALCYMYSLITKAIFEKKNIVLHSLISTAFFLSLFICVCGVKNHIKILIEGVSITTSIFPLVNQVFYNYSTIETYELTSSDFLLIYSFGFSLISLVICPLVLLDLSQTRKITLIISIALLGLNVITTIVTGILGVLSYSQSALTNPATLGGGVILTIVLTVISIGLIIASLVLQKKKGANI